MSEKFTDKLKGFISGGYDQEDYDEYDEYEEEEFLPTPPRSSSNKVVNISTNSGKNGQFRVMIYEPTQYNEDIPGIVDSLKNKKVCVVNLEKVKDPSVSGTIFHFLSGAIYAMSGDIVEVSNGVFVLAPPSVDIDGSVKKVLENKGFFKWQ